MKFRPLSLRIKLILSFLIVIIIGGLLSLSFGSRLVKNTLIDQAQTKVKHDLAAAWMVFNERRNYVKEIVRLTAERESIKEATKNNNKDILFRYLSRVREEYGLDVLTLIDSTGIVIVRTRNPDVIGDDQSQDEIIKLVPKKGVLAYPQIVPREELIKEGKDLADQAYMEFIDTPKAASRPENKETNGMMLKAASSIVDERGNHLGTLYGGILLNRNYEIVDRVKETVYKGEKYKGRDKGTATIFQHDLRISTNVPNEKGERAIGTRVSKEVNNAVLIEGNPWIDRAFVVNLWYITAYEPIKNINNKIIGILYVGMLEKPYLDITNRVMRTFIIIAFLCIVLLLVILYFSTTRIINPLQKMVVATQKISAGDLTHKVEVSSKDEIGYLADSFNQMTADLEVANEKLIEWGKTLEKRVEERTKELREMQDYLIQSEKLASLGKMSAGVAHEINNPLTSILINTHLMLEKLEKNHAFHEYLSLIADETTRCTNIVKGLLEFSRQSLPQKAYTDINEIINHTLQLLENQTSFQNISITKKLNQNLPQIRVDKDKVEQVFWNLMINASETMPSGGTLNISSQFSTDKKYIEIEFIDTGKGIPKVNINKLFDPFFTTKSSGTGLGLAVTYGIIEQHQGKIEVKSELDQGSVFTISLPIAG